MTKLACSTLVGCIIGMFIMMNPALAQKVELYADFTLSDGEDKEIKLSDYKDKKAVALIFTSSHCAWATKYEERLKELYEAYAEKEIAIIAINSNDASMSELDGSTTMRKVTVFPFPYLKDEDQKVARQFEAKRNPEVVLLTPEEKGFKLAYRGKIDDNPLDATLVRNNYLSDAIDSVLLGKKPAVASSPPSGCNIKWIE